MNDKIHSLWIFGYGSLIWGTGAVNTVEQKEDYLIGWHREWTWISARRHGAPTCSLVPGGKVKGVFLRLNVNTSERDLEELRKRERRETEETIKNVPIEGATTYFWTMGTNLSRFSEFSGLAGEQLARALAARAETITELGPDGVQAVDYIQRVHQFDPDDEVTAAIVRKLCK